MQKWGSWGNADSETPSLGKAWYSAFLPSSLVNNYADDPKTTDSKEGH